MIEKSAPKYVYAPGIAGAFFIANIFLIDKTGAGINIARSLGIAIIDDYYYHLYKL